MYSRGWLLLASLLVVVGIAAAQAVVLLLGLLLLLAAGASYLWDRYCLSRIEYRRFVTPRRAFYGETVTVTLEVTNRKPLPLAWLEVIDELPQELVPIRGRILPSIRQRRIHLVNLFSVRWYERIRRHVPMRCTARGYFRLGPVRVRSGDIFGLTVRGQDLDQVDHLLVYPKVVSLAALGLPALHPLGDVPMRRLLEDPSRVIGTREYIAGDALRRIHWKATARTGGLQAKQYEATTSPRIAIFLNLDTLGPYAEYRGFVRPTLELNILVAAAVANWAIGEDYLVGLFANGYLSQGLRWVRVAPAPGHAHLATMLEALAKIFPTPVIPIGDLMQLEARTLPWGTTAIVISAVSDEPLVAGISQLLRAGHAVVAILVGETADLPLPVPQYRVHSEIGWQALDGLEVFPIPSTASGAR